MLTEKQTNFYNLIINYYKENKTFPTLIYLKEKGNFKSYNSIYKYLNILEKKGLLIKDKDSNTYLLNNLKEDSILSIPIINENTYYKIIKEYYSKDTDYLAYKVHDNKLQSENILRGDLLIIEKSIRKINNKLVLVKMNNNYYIFKYLKQKSFANIINDKEIYTITDNITIIGKVVFLIRKLAFQTLD